MFTYAVVNFGLSYCRNYGHAKHKMPSDLFRSVIMLTVTADQYVLTTPDSRWGEVKGFPQSESSELGRTITSLHVKEQQSL